jgi:hypothetical protein
LRWARRVAPLSLVLRLGSTVCTPRTDESPRLARATFHRIDDPAVAAVDSIALVHPVELGEATLTPAALSLAEVQPLPQDLRGLLASPGPRSE